MKWENIKRIVLVHGTGVIENTPNIDEEENIGMGVLVERSLKTE